MVDQLNPASSKLPSSPSPNSSVVDDATSFDRRSAGSSSGKSQRFSLQRRATALAIVLGTLPMLGIGAINSLLTHYLFTQHVIEHQEEAATGLSNLISQYMAERYADLQTIASSPILSNLPNRNRPSFASIDAELGRLAQSYGIYNNIALFDVEGSPIRQTGQRALPNPVNQPYFRDALRSNRTTISQPAMAPDSRSYEVHLAAPIKDVDSGKTVALLRVTLPLEKLAEHLQAYTLGQHDYSLVDTTNQLFLSSQPNRIGQAASLNFPEFFQMQTSPGVNTRSFADVRNRNQEILVTYSPWSRLEGLPNLNWQLMLGNTSAEALKGEQSLLLSLGLGTLATALIIGTISTVLVRRLTQRIESVSRAVQYLGQGQLETRLRIQGDDEIATLGSNINRMASQLQHALQEQIQNTHNLQRLNEATFNIRKSIDFNVILQTGVYEARKLLDVDRAIVYLFDEHWQGRVVAESVGLEFPASLGVNIADPCFAEKFVEKYRQGRIHMICDVEKANLDPCHRSQLEQFQAKANLVAPLVVDGHLMGLLVLHHCAAPHEWDSSEVNLFCQIAVHLGNALEQVKLVQQRQKVTQTEALAEERRQQKEGLQQQLVDLLGYVEKVAMGDLTVRAAVSASEIGTVADFFNAIVESLQQLVSQVKQAALQVNTSLGAHEGAVTVLSQEALQQAQETTATLGTLEQMMQSISAVAQSAQKAATVSNTAASTAAAGGEAMDLTVQQILGLRQTIGETTKKVKRLGESSQQISKIVSLINQISVQTNLLAINAGIEAARAGDDSQGFASIAEEVGALAARASEATREIEQLVADIQRETGDVVMAMEQGTSQVVEGTRFVENAKHSLEQIIEVSHQIDQLVQSISETTVSQVETSQGITRLMQAVADVASRTSDSSSNVSNSLRQTVTIAKELQKSVETFKVT